MISQKVSDFNHFFNPSGIVVIGMSKNPAKLGYGIAKNLAQCGYAGAVHFVNPKGGTLFERPVYSAISDVPDPVDLAVLLIPAHFVPATLTACGQCGIRAAIIASGGFREVGAEGAALEAECLYIAQDYEMRLMGPNCIGLIDTHLPLDTTFLPPPGPPPGEIAFISHSGAICAAIIDWARGQGFGFSRIVSLGNQVDVTETDVLLPVAHEEHTKVLTLYLEGIDNGRSFIHTAQEITPHKPIIALKVGRSAAGQRAAASHTGALAGQENAYDASFRKAGVLRAATANEMFDWAKALAWCPLPSGKNVAVLTNAGGPGVMASDALAANGLTLADIETSTTDSLHETLSAAAGLNNPIDMLASASPIQYAESLQLLLADKHVDSVLLILPAPPMFSAVSVARALIPVIQMSTKPVVVALMGDELIQEAQAEFRAARIPEYPFPEQAASALAALTQYALFKKKKIAAPLQALGVDVTAVQTILDSHAPGFLSQDTIQKIFTAYNIPHPQTRLARSAQEAGTLAQTIGFPVVMKIASPDIPHKSDVDGVLLDVTDVDTAVTGFTRLLNQAQTQRPVAHILGVDIQPMLPSGQELIAGVVQDPQFGPLVMFGSGGVEVEGLGDVAFALAPLTPEDIDYLFSSTWAGRKLAGHRNVAGVDVTAVADFLIRLAQLASDFPQIAEIEINPLRAYAQDTIALDSRVLITGHLNMDGT